VALTFDDGPWPDGTRQILDLLDASSFHATFFIWGEQAVAHRDLVREALAAGHPLQPHCWHHTSHHQMSPDEIRTDLDDILELLRELGADRPTLWRPPWGQCKGSVTRELAADRRLELAGWTIDSADYAGRPATAMFGQIVAQLEAASEAGESPVLLMHDCPLETEQWNNRQNVNETVELLRMLIAEDRWSFGPLARGLEEHLDPATA